MERLKKEERRPSWSPIECVSSVTSLEKKQRQRGDLRVFTSMRRQRGRLWLLICIALASLFVSPCSSSTSFSSKLCSWLQKGGSGAAHHGVGKSSPNTLLSSFSFLQPRLKSSAAAAAAPPRPPPLRVWIDSFGLAKGESTIMLEEIEVRRRARKREREMQREGRTRGSRRRKTHHRKNEKKK